MIQFFGQLMKLPLEAFVYSMEMLVKTMRGIQQIAYQGIDMVADGVSQPICDDAAGAESDSITNVTNSASGDRAEIAQEMPQKEESKMAGREFREEELKLVRYKILFVKRDYETVFYEKEELVHDNITESDFVGWKIAEFIQGLDKQPIPEAWQKKDYPRDVKNQSDPKIIKLDEDDKKYIRVYLEVLDSYPRERFRYEEEQIKVLTDIKNELRQKVDLEKRQVEVLEDVRDKIGGGGTGSPPYGS